MIDNETMRSILTRRSHKMFDGRRIGDEELETIITAGLYAPTGMNGQPWHFSIIRDKAVMDEIARAKASTPHPAPSGPTKAKPYDPYAAAGITLEPMRNAPVLIIVSGKESHMTNFEDCCLATENMLIAASSMEIMGGWDHFIVLDLFKDGANSGLKAKLIPDGYIPRCAIFLGYPLPVDRDRGERHGTVAYF